MSQSSRVRRSFRALSLLGVIALILTIGVAPVLTSGADHLDAPSLGSISVNPDDTLNVSKVRGPLDINDVYAFRGSSASRTVLAMTVNPAINVLGPTTFQQRAKYFLNVDTGTDASRDVRIRTTFSRPDGDGIQRYTVRLNGRTVATGRTDGSLGKAYWNGSGVKAFAGMRSDPFFFDLLGFLGTVKGQGTRTLNDGNESDFFVGLNTLAIVVEVPNQLDRRDWQERRRVGDHPRQRHGGRPDGPPRDQHGLQLVDGRQGGVQRDRPREAAVRDGRQVPHRMSSTSSRPSRPSTQRWHTRTDRPGRWPMSCCRTSFATRSAPWRPVRSTAGARQMT